MEPRAGHLTIIVGMRERVFANARRVGHLTIFFKCPGFAGEECSQLKDSHIIPFDAAFIRGRRLIE